MSAPESASLPYSPEPPVSAAPLSSAAPASPPLSAVPAMPAIPDGGEDAAGNVLEQGMGVIGTADSVFTWGGYFQAIAILFCIIGLLWFALWFLKRRGGIQKLGILSRDLTIESRLALGAKNYLIVVRFLNKRLLLGVSDQRITLLTELADDEDEQAGNTHAAGDAASFRDALRAARKNGEDEA